MRALNYISLTSKYHLILFKMNLCVACIGQTVLPGVVIWCLDFMMFENIYCILAILSHKSTSSLYLMPTHRQKSFKQRNQNRCANKITCELPPFRPFNIFQCTFGDMFCERDTKQPILPTIQPLDCFCIHLKKEPD